MARMTRAEAGDILQRCKVPAREDFHRLDSDQVAALICEADRVKYRRPKNANGSRARYFHAYVVRSYDNRRSPDPYRVHCAAKKESKA